MPLRLVLRNILAHPLRSSMTTGSVILAVFLLCMLRAMVAGLESPQPPDSAIRDNRVT